MGGLGDKGLHLRCIPSLTKFLHFHFPTHQHGMNGDKGGE